MTELEENRIYIESDEDFTLWEDTLVWERELAYESELEQDEHPRNYDDEFEDESEEAAPLSRKRLKREVQAAALERLERAVRTRQDFEEVIEEWDRLDRNRERRERDHENLRGDVPLEYGAVPDPRVAPLWMNTPTFRQLSKGNFLDIIFSCPHELHELTANPFISELIQNLTLEQKEVLYYLSVKQYSTTELAAVRGQTDRNIRKLRRTIHKTLQREMYQHLTTRQKNGAPLTMQERLFVAEYADLMKIQGGNTVIRRENKTAPRKKKGRR